MKSFTMVKISVIRGIIILSLTVLYVFNPYYFALTKSISNKSLYSIEELKDKVSSAIKAGDQKKAVELFKQLVEKEPGNDRVRANYAKYLFVLKDYTHSIKEFKVLLKSKNSKIRSYAKKMLPKAEKLATKNQKMIIMK